MSSKTLGNIFPRKMLQILWFLLHSIKADMKNRIRISGFEHELQNEYFID